MNIISVEEAKEIAKKSSDEEKVIAEKIGEIILDEELLATFKNDPLKVMKGKGLTLKDGFDVKCLAPGQEVVDPDSSIIWIRLPDEAELKKLKSTELEDEDLDNVVGGIGITLGIICVVGIIALAGTIGGVTGGVVYDRQKEREHIRKMDEH